MTTISLSFFFNILRLAAPCDFPFLSLFWLFSLLALLLDTPALGSLG